MPSVGPHCNLPNCAPPNCAPPDCAPPDCATDIMLAQCRLDDDHDISLAKAEGWLSASETDRAERFHFARDRNRYIRGRGFLRSMLGQVCGQNPASLALGVQAQGKPVLQNSHLAFNLSHSRGLAVLAISETGPLGLDLEFIDRDVDIAGLAQTCLTAEEARVLETLPEIHRAARFFAFWTAKEARMKLTGEGMSLPPRQIALDLRNGLPVGYLRPQTVQAQAVFLDLGHPGSVCCLAVAQGQRPQVISLAPQGIGHAAR